VFTHFLEFKALIEKKSCLKILTLRTNNGGEYRSNEFLNYCRKNGIKQEFTNSYFPQHNGFVERKKMAIVEMAQSMLKTKSFRNDFWVEAVHIVVYTLNICPMKEILNSTREEAWS